MLTVNYEVYLNFTTDIEGNINIQHKYCTLRSIMNELNVINCETKPNNW